MKELIQQCDCGISVEPEEFERDTEFFSTKGTQWGCENCGKFSRDHESTIWKPAFFEDLERIRNRVKEEANLTKKQRQWKRWKEIKAARIQERTK